jgi:NAD(P)-dependent dehydrogenase (short-subunit alcohol dehydrogenase family)
MDLQLRGKRALVTGSTAGIGFAVAVGLFKDRLRVQSDLSIRRHTVYL